MRYDVIIIGAGPGGIFSAYEILQKNSFTVLFPNYPVHFSKQEGAVPQEALR